MRGLARLDGPARVQGVDLARGIAVIGMFVSHLVVTAAFDFSEPGTWSDLAYGRSAILFATLAGVSIGLLTGGTRPLAGAPLARAAGRIAVRAVLLWFLGVWLISFGTPLAVILPAYGILFLLALPFLRVPARVLFPLALVLGVAMPFVVVWMDDVAAGALAPGSEAWQVLGWEYPFVAWIAFVLAGLGVARAGIGSTRTQVALLVGGTVLAVVGYGLGATFPADPETWWGRVWASDGHTNGILEIVGSGGFAIAVIGLCALACRTVVSGVVLPLRAVGSMPLTAYTLQVVVWAIVATVALGDASDMTGIRALGFFWYLLVGTLVFCTAWALLVGRGPLEWATERIARIAVPGPQSSERRVDA